MTGTRPVIEVQELSKQYRLGEHQLYGSLRETVAKTIGRLVHGRGGVPPATIWALRGVSFEVGPGEVVGIIGRNGAGKSTLLKVLSRITEPTSGRAKIRGRVGSLLEVGTGFHPELTGRENVFLAGSILGMRRREIVGKLDSIVAFAEVERFVDTPIKRYSSGMYTRLAFSVAAHLEPEILLVDEVLAVGDTEFQRKCLGKMKEVACAGRTVLFVSHSMEAIQRLCPRAIRIADGKIAGDGNASQIVKEYLGLGDDSPPTRPVIGAGSALSGLEVELNGQGPGRVILWDLDRPLEVVVQCRSEVAVPRLVADLTVYRLDGLRVFGVSVDSVLADESPVAEPATATWTRMVSITCPAMARGTFYLDVGIRQPQHGAYEVLWNHVATITTTGGGSAPLVAAGSIVVPEVRVAAGSLHEPSRRVSQ